jgi:hypothetical protein
MDFSHVELSPEDQAFYKETRAFIVEHVTDDVLRRDREFGENFDEQVQRWAKRGIWPRTGSWSPKAGSARFAGESST